MLPSLTPTSTPSGQVVRMVKPIRPSPSEMSPYGLKLFQNLLGMKFIQMVTGKWYENYPD